MKVILSWSLPKGWIREKGPQGKIIYYNEIDDEISFDHPLTLFFRKTFAKILGSDMDHTKEQIIRNLIIDEVSKISIDRLTKKKMHIEKEK